MSQPPAAPEPTEIARRYQVVQKLGAGAFGTVYKAKDKILGRMVAIKTIRLEGLAAAGVPLEELMERFNREAQVSAQLKHPNIVTIYDVGEAEGVSYLAMEFIDGVGLERLIRNEKTLPVDRAAAIGAQVADALDFAHKNSVVHRDIKPANIMIEAGDRVKVTDFGIAKVTTSTEQLTVTGSLLGTPSYMSPEQARGQGLDGRSDLFSLGCVLYEMIAGTKAFTGDSITGLIFKIITEEPRPLAELEPTVPPELVRIIGKALAKSKDERYQTGEELARDLLVFTKPGSTPTVRFKETPTSRGMVAVVAPPAAAAGSPTVSSAPTALAPGKPEAKPPAPRPSPPPPPPPPPSVPSTTGAPVGGPMVRPQVPRSPSRAPVFIILGLGLLVLLGLAGAGLWLFLHRGVSPTTAALTPSPAASVPATEPSPSATLAPPPESIPPATEAAAPASEASLAPAPARPQPAPSAPPPTTAAAAPPVTSAQAAPPAPRGGFGYLDREPEPVDGREAGRRLAQGFRGSGGGSFGTSRTLRRRERSPRDLVPVEFPAVATLRHVMNAEEAFYRREGRYGSYEDLRRSGMLRLDVPIKAARFLRRNYHFDLQLTEDGYRITATPVGIGGRAFVGDDSGYIRAGVD